MRSHTWLLAAALLGPQVAWAEEPAVTELRREVSELRREISDLRREIYALRLDLLTAIGQLSGHGVGTAPVAVRPVPGAPPAPAAPAAEPAPAAPAAPATPAAGAKESGVTRVTGRVQLEGGSGQAYVYVENVPTQLAKGAALDIKQSGRQFQPRAAVVQAGTKLNFPNLDSMYHNVFSKTPGNTFDLGIYRAGDPMRSYTVTNPGVVDIFCDMHSEMTASILVVPSKLYVAVGADGTFTLENVPRGSRKLVAWAPGFEAKPQVVSVTGNGATADFSLRPKSAAHTNKSGLPYGSYK